MGEFQRDTEITPVLFRKCGPRRGGEVIALFPAELGTYELHTCSSYVRVGQHGSASIAGPDSVIHFTRRATPVEYADLQKELEGSPFGYRLKVYQRITRQHDDARKAQYRALHAGMKG